MIEDYFCRESITHALRFEKDNFHENNFDRFFNGLCEYTFYIEAVLYRRTGQDWIVLKTSFPGCCIGIGEAEAIKISRDINSRLYKGALVDQVFYDDEECPEYKLVLYFCDFEDNDVKVTELPRITNEESNALVEYLNNLYSQIVDQSFKTSHSNPEIFSRVIEYILHCEEIDSGLILEGIDEDEIKVNISRVYRLCHSAVAYGYGRLLYQFPYPRIFHHIPKVNIITDPDDSPLLYKLQRRCERAFQAGRGTVPQLILMPILVHGQVMGYMHIELNSSISPNEDIDVGNPNAVRPLPQMHETLGDTVYPYYEAIQKHLGCDDKVYIYYFTNKLLSFYPTGIALIDYDRLSNGENFKNSLLGYEDEGGVINNGFTVDRRLFKLFKTYTGLLGEEIHNFNHKVFIKKFFDYKSELTDQRICRILFESLPLLFRAELTTIRFENSYDKLPEGIGFYEYHQGPVINKEIEYQHLFSEKKQEQSRWNDIFKVFRDLYNGEQHSKQINITSIDESIRNTISELVFNKRCEYSLKTRLTIVIKSPSLRSMVLDCYFTSEKKDIEEYAHNYVQDIYQLGLLSGYFKNKEIQRLYEHLAKRLDTLSLSLISFYGLPWHRSFKSKWDHDSFSNPETEFLKDISRELNLSELIDAESAKSLFLWLNDCDDIFEPWDRTDMCMDQQRVVKGWVLRELFENIFTFKQKDDSYRKIDFSHNLETDDYYHLPCSPGLPFIISLRCLLNKLCLESPPEEVNFQRIRGVGIAVTTLQVKLQESCEDRVYRPFNLANVFFNDSNGNAGRHTTSQYLKDVISCRVPELHRVPPPHPEYFDLFKKGTEHPRISVLFAPYGFTLSWQNIE